MDDATLERLMIDDSLGALEPDVSALLAAYSAGLPEAQRQAARWRQIADRADAAIEDRTAVTLPPFPARQLQAARWRRAVGVGLAMAAAVMLGLGIGLMVPQRTGNGIVAKATQSQAEAPREAAVNDFWSTQRLVAAAVERNRQGHGEGAFQ